jgi:hypothetical protein
LGTARGEGVDIGYLQGLIPGKHLLLARATRTILVPVRVRGGGGLAVRMVHIFYVFIMFCI